MFFRVYVGIVEEDNKIFYKYEVKGSVLIGFLVNWRLVCIFII